MQPYELPHAHTTNWFSNLFDGNISLLLYKQIDHMFPWSIQRYLYRAIIDKGEVIMHAI